VSGRVVKTRMLPGGSASGKSTSWGSSPVLTITGRPMKDGRPAAIWESAVRADGKKYDPREGFRVK